MLAPRGAARSITIGYHERGTSSHGRYAFHCRNNDPYVGEPRAAFLPAGGRVSGSIFFVDCDGPNPGFATAPLTLALMLGRANNFATMIVFPLSVEVALRLRKN